MARRFSPLVLILGLAACGTVPGNPRLEADQAYGRGEYEAAIERYSRAIEKDPRDFRAYFGRGRAKLCRVAEGLAEDALSVTAQAVEDFDAVLRLCPVHPQARYCRGVGYCVLGRYKAAVRDFLWVVQFGTGGLRRRAHRKLALLYDEKLEDQEDRAREHLEKYLQLGGSDAGALQRLAELREGSKNKRKPEGPGQVQALEEAKKLARAGDRGKALGKLSAILKEPRLSKETLSEAKLLYARLRVEEREEKEARTMVDLAARLAQEGKCGEARLLLKEALERFPQSDAAKERGAVLLQVLEGANGEAGHE